MLFLVADQQADECTRPNVRLVPIRDDTLCVDDLHAARSKVYVPKQHLLFANLVDRVAGSERSQ